MTYDLPSHELKDRILWGDGDSSISSGRMANILLRGGKLSGIHPLELDRSIKKYNLLSPYKLDIKRSLKELDTKFTIPDAYIALNLRNYMYSALRDNLVEENITNESDVEARIVRVDEELQLFKEYDIEDLIKTAIYIVEKFKSSNVVWGTGRGSSCACYCLYLIGLHDVDSVRYNLQLSEFFR